jgi:hypothetical protein
MLDIIINCHLIGNCKIGYYLVIGLLVYWLFQ